MKLAKLALLLLFITFCTEDNNLSIENNADEALENESNNQEAVSYTHLTLPTT